VKRTSEVILRNRERLGSGPVLLLNPERDSLAFELRNQAAEIRASSQDFATFRWLESGAMPCSFEVIPSIRGDEETLILTLPREKARLSMMLAACASSIGENTRLWLVGENRSGIKSSPRLLREYFGDVEKLDSARHCALFEARRPRNAGPFDLQSWLTPWKFDCAGQSVSVLSLPGVFAHGRLDRGTELLLEAVAELKPEGRILDFACGSGIVGLCLKAGGFRGDLTMLDVSALALESTRSSLHENGVSATVLASDGLSEVSGQYDWIISNPPFHQGVSNDLEVSRNFFRSAGTFLGENGRILIVFNRHLPYARWLDEVFERVDRLAARSDYSVVCASVPTKYRAI
jgi:16S rRNA (guanine1207-N2)-methyltransferase